MFNTIATQLIIYITRSFNFRPMPEIPRVPRIFDIETIRLDWGFIAALVLAALVSFVLFKTTLGF